MFIKVYKCMSQANHNQLPLTGVVLPPLDTQQLLNASYDSQEHPALMGMHAEQLGPEPLALDVANMHPIEIYDSIALLGIIDVSGTAVNLSASIYADGKIDTSMVFLTRADSSREVSTEVTNDIPVPLIRGASERTFGRKGFGASSLKLDKNRYVSGQHFKAEFNQDGKLMIADADSTNGTRLITAESSRTPEILHQRESAGMVAGHMAIESVVGPLALSKEFMVAGTKYKLDGAYKQNGELAFSAETESGEMRQFFVYRSQSEGSLRVSIGRELTETKDGKLQARYLKGAELSDNHQYTQESQLHPDFQKAVESLDYNASDLPKVSDQLFDMNAARATSVMKDFEAHRKVYSLGNEKLARSLTMLDANNFGAESLAKKFNTDPGKVGNKVVDYVKDLNKLLRKADVVPDFSTPIRTETDEHPTLGNINKEVYAKTIGGRTYEWCMASDSKGRVWIDRIRLGDTTPNAYGTDSEMVFSGILTSKPIDYRNQTTGLPISMQKDVNGRYADITGLLDTLSPIQDYRNRKQIIKQV
jgi:hypothetical protein